MKEQVADNVPKRIKHLQFGAMSPSDILKYGATEISSRELYTADTHMPAPNGALDPRLGVAYKDASCETCGEKMAHCVGHYGHVRLALPAFHVGFLKAIITTLQNICKSCSRVLLDETSSRRFKKELRRPGLDNLRRQIVCRHINDVCRKSRRCMHCGVLNGVVKKVGALKIIHDQFRFASKRGSPEEEEFRKTFDEAVAHAPELRPHIHKAADDLNPLKVLHLFERIPTEDCELLGLDPMVSRPETFIWQYVPAPPICIRPSVAQDGATNEDDLTIKLTEIVWTNSLIRAAMEKGTPILNLMEQWDFLQLSIAMYINSELPGVHGSQAPSKPIRGFAQRLKGKQGRFRGNLSGKRVDFSGRTVISPDPNLSIEQVAIPERVAKILTYPERVTDFNIDNMRQAIINGADNHPGANYLIEGKTGHKRFLKIGDRAKCAQALRVGDIVERHLRDGDVILFNRQPSLHKLSIMSFYVKVRPWRTFRLNECVCNPFNADFDGDEMNVHVPQTEEARTEALELMGVKHNLQTSRNGEPIIGAIQDFITVSFLITRKDVFFDRKTFQQICAYMVDADIHVDIPPPTILKPEVLWTGKQIFTVLMRPHKSSNVLINFEAKGRSFKQPENGLSREMCPNDSYINVKGSELLCGALDKSIVGEGKKNSLFYVILRDYSASEAVAAMSRLSKLAARWIGTEGFSIGINDVQPGQNLGNHKDQLIERAYNACDELIIQAAKGTLESQPGCNQEQTLEAKISGYLSRVRDDVGQICMNELASTNAALIMATCGSKGSKINVSQMVACVGQQIISGQRVPDGFQDRALPHFLKNSKQPPSKGFVRNSFYSGLEPTEFFFHAISGREGLVDTAVKTAETGYMSRRLMKSLEDLSSAYDGSVRNASNGMVQFIYGNDGLDPTYMEGDGKPVDFFRTWKHCENMTESSAESISVDQILKYITLFAASTPNHEPLEQDFRDSVANFIKENILPRLSTLEKTIAKIKLPKQLAKISVTNILKISIEQLELFCHTCLRKYACAKVEPGTAIGAIGAQSIGEPGTQMTLKTFHFAGVASMNVTLGVPRIKEIINASKFISTPIITCTLSEGRDVRAARIVKGRIEKTYLQDIAFSFEDVFSSTACYMGVHIDFETVSRLQLELTMEIICAAIVKSKLKVVYNDIQIISKDQLRVFTPTGDVKSGNDQYTKLQYLKRALPKVIVKGIATISRAVINEEKNGNNQLLIEGYGLRQVINTIGVVGRKTYTNHVMEMQQVLGIEAARLSIINEINTTMESHGMNIDHRHIRLLGDVMTFKGEVLGITRFGVAKMKDSVLMLASFEKTIDHLFDAAFAHKRDAIEGVSECIIMGIPMYIGTGSFALHQPIVSNVKIKVLAFDRPELHCET